MVSTLVSLLQTHFGFDHFRPGQETAVANLLDGKHTLVVMPTGSGKSLIYQLTALERPGLTLVISPLIALMKDQVDSLDRRGIPATFINSSIPASQQNLRLQNLAAGKYRILYVAPERLRSVPFLNAMRRQSVQLLAVDEAHCISEWGHDFRPDYLHIAGVRTALRNPLTVALTATATPQVQDDIVRLLGLPTQAARVVTGFNRSNLALQVRYTPRPQAKQHALRELLGNLKQGAAIIYTGTRREAEEVAQFCREEVRIDAEHYHAGLDAEERGRIQDAFITGRLSAVAATNAFGMGIDRPDVRLVIHYNLPGSLEAYYQEAGRAGRDGLPARAVLLYAPDDRALQEWFIKTSETAPQDLSTIYNSLGGSPGSQVRLSCDVLSRRTSIPQVKIRVALAELEQAGAVEHLSDEGARMLLRRGPWNMPAITVAVQRGKHRLAHRREQLDNMVQYAESKYCRRAILLAHFGDPGPVEAPICCDNCTGKRFSSAPIQLIGVQAGTEKTGGPVTRPLGSRNSVELTAAILECVGSLPGLLPRSGVAKLLVGSDAESVQKFRQHPLFNRLRGCIRREVLAQVDRLLAIGQLALNERGYVVLATECPTGTPSISAVAETSLSSQHVFLLGERGSAEAVPELIQALQDPNGNIRRLAASALGKIADQRAVGPLMELLAQEKKPQVRQYAVKALGNLKDPRAIELLQTIAGNDAEKDYTRTAARCAVKKIKA